MTGPAIADLEDREEDRSQGICAASVTGEVKEVDHLLEPPKVIYPAHILFLAWSEFWSIEP
jgi:hypothetical protein